MEAPTTKIAEIPLTTHERTQTSNVRTKIKNGVHAEGVVVTLQKNKSKTEIITVRGTIKKEEVEEEVFDTKQDYPLVQVIVNTYPNCKTYSVDNARTQIFINDKDTTSTSISSYCDHSNFNDDGDIEIVKESKVHCNQKWAFIIALIIAGLVLIKVTFFPMEAEE